MPKEPRVYGTPTGAEKPSQATDRKAAKPATDRQVHEAVKGAKSDPWHAGREAPPRQASEKATGGVTGDRINVIDEIKDRGKKIDASVDAAS